MRDTGQKDDEQGSDAKDHIRRLGQLEEVEDAGAGRGPRCPAPTGDGRRRSKRTLGRSSCVAINPECGYMIGRPERSDVQGRRLVVGNRERGDGLNWRLKRNEIMTPIVRATPPSRARAA